MLEFDLESIGLLGIAIIIFIESAFPFGFILPGDTLLFAAGILAAKGHFGLIALMIVVFTTTVAGVTIGYFSGKQVGKRLFNKEDAMIFRREYVESAKKFYERHGGKAVILGRFVPAVRSFVPLVAGIAHMNYKKFMFYNIIGGLIWATTIPLLGFYAGGWLESRGINVDHLILPIIAVIILLSLLGPMVHALHDPVSREKLLRKLRLRK
ncbi:MAG TPA: DedA family protein [Candidatus Saccharimonadales bacterium]